MISQDYLGLRLAVLSDMLRIAILVALLTSGCAGQSGAETTLAFSVIIGTMLCRFSDPDDQASRA